ncbi:hypothetical protein [Anatilimnocola floriformis]|uniref:hypothetical protein n=1 Tax=Anatilimnocola floriformis TaxID=2948575 RepID=UPI0020C5915A|nr:hypothetical protein [Anatilimnocola floriformis]
MSLRDDALTAADEAIDRATVAVQEAIERKERMRRHITRCVRNLSDLLVSSFDDELSTGEAAAVDAMLKAAAAIHEWRRTAASNVAAAEQS